MDNNEEITLDVTTTELDDKLGFVEYVSGLAEDGRDYWAYIVMRPSRYLEYYKLVSEKADIDLDDFGDVLAEWYDVEPSLEVRKEIETAYALNPGLQEKFTALGNRMMLEISQEAVDGAR